MVQKNNHTGVQLKGDERDVISAFNITNEILSYPKRSITQAFIGLFLSELGSPCLSYWIQVWESLFRRTIALWIRSEDNGLTSERII